MDEKNILAIVVTYNRCEMLKGCLDALKNQTIPCHILVVDNASVDKTKGTVGPYLSEMVHYHRMEKNVGGAGGFHAGMRYGVEAGYRYLWLMDDDACPEPNALEELLKAANHVYQEFGFLCSAVLWTDGKECRMNRPKLRENCLCEVDLLQHGMLAVEQATFVSCLFRADTVQNAGLPIKEFFLWGDDIEYTRRLAVRKKLPCYLVGKSVVVHRMAANTGSDISTDSPERLNRYACAYRNEHYLYRQEGARGIAFYCARCALHLVRIWTKAKDCRLKRSWVLISSFVRGFGFNPGIEFVSKEPLFHEI